MSVRSEIAALSFEGVRVTYPAASRGTDPVQALQGIDLSLRPGVIAGLVGVNGAGKTTILDLAVGSIRPTSGIIRWFGSPVLDRTVRRRIGFCPAVPVIPQDLTLREALFLYAGLRELARNEAARQVAELIGRFRLEPLAAQRISALSTGNVVRAGLAQALLGRPDLLLLDESFAALDPRAQSELRSTLEMVASDGTAVLVSSHQLDQLEKVAHQAYIVHEGRLIRRLTRDEFRKRRVLVLDVRDLSDEQRLVMHRRFPGARGSGDRVLIPLSSDGSDEEEIRSQLVERFAGARILGVQDESLESAVLEIANS
ncbi:MAG TPA: ABC transporter ATP-binding protein [Longimicrobiales bacterium]